VAAAAPQRIGSITHYYPHVNAGVVQIESGELRVGETIHVHGHTTDFYQRVDRIEIEHQAVEVARAGQSVGVHVTQRVREGDGVWKVPSR
jgi:putative protease